MIEENPQADSLTLEEFENILKEKCIITGEVLATVMCAVRMRSVKWVG
jgi:hypothetical protein